MLAEEKGTSRRMPAETSCH